MYGNHVIAKSFKKHLSELEPVYWDYYHSQGRYIKNPFLSSTDHSHFIDQYFKVAGKKMVLENFPVKNLERPPHVTSTFFLGLLIIAKCDLSKILSLDGQNLPGYDQLPFVWFLTTLFHDFAETKESDREFHTEIQSINDLQRKYRIEHDLLSQQIRGVNPMLFDAIPNYFRLRHSRNCVDHGIHAGLYAFDLLVKNRIDKKAKRAGDLSWEDYLDDQYALACACVATHNIWVNQSSLPYENFELKHLAEFTPYKLIDYPLPYVFSIVDTIDPVKFFCCQSNKHENIPLDDLLHGIGFSFEPEHIYIHNISLDATRFQSYFKRVKTNLKGWLHHKIRQVQQGKIKITIN